MRRTMTEVRTFNVKLYCDCGGEMGANGVTLNTNPPRHPHVCEHCDTVEVIEGEHYPRQETLEVGEPQDIPEI